MPDEFDEIMDRWDEHRSEQSQAAEAAEDERSRFLREFEDWVENIAKPAMEEMAERVRSRGHIGQVQRLAPGQKHERPGIELRVGPAEVRMSSMRFTHATFSNAVGVHMTTAQGVTTSSGAIDNRPMEELDGDAIRRIAMELIEATFTPRRSS